MAFTETEKARIRYHLGYANVSFAFTFVMGFGATIPFQSVLEGNLDKSLPEIDAKVRELLQRLDDTELQMFDNQELLLIDGISTITVRKEGQARFRNQYQYWQNSLAMVFTVQPNPYDPRFLMNGVNVPRQQ